MPVTLDQHVQYPLRALGVAPIALTQASPVSDRVPFVVPSAAAGGAKYLKIRMDVDVVTQRSCRAGYGYLYASAGSGPSVAVELVQRCRAGQRILRWSSVTTAGARHGWARSRHLRVSVTNYTLFRDARPGRHYLTFSLETAHGLRVQRARILPRSGLRPTNEPPYTVALDVAPAEVRAEPGQPATLHVAVRNSGTTTARAVRLAVVESDDLVVANRAVLMDWPAIRPRRVVSRALRLLPRRPGAWKVDLAVDSSKGSDIKTVSVIAASEQSELRTGGASGPPRGLMIAIWIASITLACFGYQRYARRSGRRAR